MSKCIKVHATKMNEERLKDDLVIYDSNQFTRNAHGIEVRVNSRGIIDAVAPNLHISNGAIVISGHGKMQEFLEAYALVGMRVHFNKQTKELTFSTEDFERIQFIYENYLEDIHMKIARSKANHEVFDGNILGHVLQEFETKKAQLDQKENLPQLEIDLNRLYQEALNALTVSKEIEARGVWHRPTEKNLLEIQLLLDDLMCLNINEIYVETFWNGYAIYPSKTMPTHRHLNGDYGKYCNDYLSALIEEAKLRNITVHAWLENFFVGVKGQKHSELWYKYPDWRIINYDFSEVQHGKPGGEEEGFLFFDVANDNVQDLLIKFYKELVSSYDLCGIQLDYIRYPAANKNYLFSSGYTKYAVHKFNEMYQIHQDIRAYVKKPEQYALWNTFRMQCVTNFVQRVFHEVLSIRPEMLLSIAVGPDASHAKLNLMQDWRTWVENGWIDIIAPMAYVRSREAIKDIVLNMNGLSANKTYNYTGIGPTYFKLPSHYNRELIDESSVRGGLGQIIFAYHNLKNNKEVKQTLLASTHRRSAVRPHDDIDKVLKKGYDIIEEALLIHKIPITDIKNVFDKALEVQSLEHKKIMVLELKKLLEIKNLKQPVNIIQNLIKIIDIKIYRKQMRSQIGYAVKQLQNV